ncbi:hypothetical protein ACFMJK_25315, partial [Acinetobacter baumannii]
ASFSMATGSLACLIILKAKTGVDRVAGSIVSVLGLKLIFFK